ncbi:amidase domain-containing protein [Bacillus sp. CGMCC 1.16607]|uniref:amidase domain-containing protein n=1 Tax=Bacillus sp. CGMCC 1.16607 TaxID=3351842 RepID=UPI00363E1037
MREQLQKLLEERVKQCITNPSGSDFSCIKIEKKKENNLKRFAEIVKAKATGKILNKSEIGDNTNVSYQVHFQYLIKQKGQLYLEEEMELRMADFFKGTLIKDEEVRPFEQNPEVSIETDVEYREESRIKFQYNRLKAVQYAERWWNDYNPAFKKIEANDCTNFISQCLYAGGAPMRGYPNKGNGWWMKGNAWSWSWTVAHAFRKYLGNSTTGLRAKEVSRPDQLLLGDVICYDFEGDGRFNHNTIVTGKDYYGMPLVNAHTYNSRLRYWAYEDSTAYTPNIKYKFFTIVDDE